MLGSEFFPFGQRYGKTSDLEPRTSEQNRQSSNFFRVTTL